MYHGLRLFHKIFKWIKRPTVAFKSGNLLTFRDWNVGRLEWTRMLLSVDIVWVYKQMINCWSNNTINMFVLPPASISHRISQQTLLLSTAKDSTTVFCAKLCSPANKTDCWRKILFKQQNPLFSQTWVIWERISIFHIFRFSQNDFFRTVLMY